MNQSVSDKRIKIRRLQSVYQVPLHKSSTRSSLGVLGCANRKLRHW